ncbi:acireductone synthase [Streptomyces sp. NPDC127190]|uniref:acireductone synthase n=1 Tax=unclassified Streptomyces TaxID=2593676 RepID=UPI0036396F04
MSQRFEADCVVLDIEGTTSATGFVVDVLYPYAQARFGALLSERADDPDVRDAVDRIRELAGEPDADAARIEQVLGAWVSEDRKASPLKKLQGILWSEGFAKGELVSHFYDDVIPAIRAWHARRVRLFVYSSGSVAAQRSWFAHSPHGDLMPLVEGLFDTENAGPKVSSDSYRAISKSIAAAPERTLFLSDRTAELDAARSADWLTLRIRRPGEPYYEQDTGEHPEALSFADIDVTSARSAR